MKAEKYKIVKEIDGGLEFQTIYGPKGRMMSTCGDAYWSLIAVRQAYSEGYEEAIKDMREDNIK